MKRRFLSFPITDFFATKDSLLTWAATFDYSCFLDNNNYNARYKTYECVVGAGLNKRLPPDEKVLQALSQFDQETDDWIFGHLNYGSLDEAIVINNGYDGTSFPDISFFVPQVVVLLSQDRISIGVLEADPTQVLATILQQPRSPSNLQSARLQARMSKDDFIGKVKKLQEHIHYGDCYEINFCQEFYAERSFIDPVDVYRQLSEISPAPFSCFYKLKNHFVLCSSPERFLQRSGNKIISQPIKGTAPRNLLDSLEDDAIRSRLLTSEKDRRENIIVVDLVRNDLGKICEAGSVVVDELCQVYSFPTVHQMISTVAGQLSPGLDFASIVAATFPMGSMTGAPKKRVMELLEKYELTKRGVYSGTIGYISPEKNFDFNVVIRSIVYDDQKGYISYHTGAGITFASDPFLEYQECLLKAAAVNKIFSN